jgi:hypothetical protein
MVVKRYDGGARYRRDGVSSTATTPRLSTPSITRQVRKTALTHQREQPHTADHDPTSSPCASHVCIHSDGTATNPNQATHHHHL